VTFKIKLAMC